ncbi:hypothetical protein, partial [Arthrobacter sp. A2-55]|uniref:hypothetical protein n=1 Tax=Arthrobacter sp. A2-55 TaxID=2897337 RepID=UPI0021CDAF6F
MTVRGSGFDQLFAAVGGVACWDSLVHPSCRYEESPFLRGEMTMPIVSISPMFGRKGLVVKSPGEFMEILAAL